MISGVDHEAIFHFTPDDNDSTQEYFLRMDKAESQQQRIIIEYICECKVTLLKEWVIKTIKSHKFESSTKGKNLNFAHAFPLILYLDENRNNNCEIPQNEQKKRRVEILPLVLKKSLSTDGNSL